MYLAAAASPPRSWAGIWALILGYVGFRIVVFFWRKWREATPTPLSLPMGSRPKVQATVGVNTGDTSRDTDPDTDGWELREGSWWYRALNSRWYPVVKQIVRTGSTTPPAEPELEAAPEQDGDGLTGDRSEQLTKYITDALAVPVPYSHIVRIAVKHYQVSESTVKRRIREIRKAQDGETAA